MSGSVRKKPPKTADPRIDARVTPEIKERIRLAAELQGLNMTDFMISTLVQAANRTIEQHMVLRLSVEDSRVFADALLKPPEPNANLVKAAKRWANRNGKK